MHHGSCLCGGVAYEIDGEIGPIVYCHCSMCRRWHGTAFRTRAAVRKRDFRFVRGEELISEYRSSPDTLKRFCRVCGSPLVNSWDPDPEHYGLALGTLATDPGRRPACHVFVGSKAPWYEITDELPQFAEFPPARG
jgi:hypothetical protein